MLKVRQAVGAVLPATDNFIFPTRAWACRKQNPAPCPQGMSWWGLGRASVKVSGTQSCLSLCNLMDYSPPDSPCPWDSWCKNTGIGCHSLLQGVIPIQEPNHYLLHHRQILYCLSHQDIRVPYKWLSIQARAPNGNLIIESDCCSQRRPKRARTWWV